MSKKRKRDHEEADALPGQVETETKARTDHTGQAAQTKSEKKKGRARQERSERRSKKLKKSQEQSHPPPAEGDPITLDNNGDGEDATEVQAPAQDQPAEVNKNHHKKTKKLKSAAGNEKGMAPASTRFIAFVGNLPFDATAAQVKEHFSKLAPTSVRLSTDKATGKSRGFAFVEFDGYDKMKTCLKLYHHSLFDPRGKEDGGEQGAKAAGPSKKARRINVELTAGGGGKKSQDRISKIKMKNDKLNEERKRRSIQEKLEQQKAAVKVKKSPGSGANAAEATETGNDYRGAIHPSRLSRVSH